VNANGAGYAAAALQESSPRLAAVLRGGDVAAGVAGLPADRLPGVLVEIAALQTQLAAASHAISARLLAAPATELGARSGEASCLLGIKEAAARLGVSSDWLYRHARQLPFTRRVGRRALRFDPEGLGRWVATQRRG
jgi:predicted DNA-binding transcriptional regulator AlpA